MAKKRKKVFITGGSGFLGINLIRFLYKRGYDIKVIDIAPFDYPDMKDKIEFVQGDIRNSILLEKEMKGCDFVVHTAAALPLYTKNEIFSTEVRGTRNVMEAARWLKIDRVVHISSTAVYGVPDHHPLYETDKRYGVGPYGEAKVMAEKVCEEYRKKGVCISIIRPKSFIGPERLGVFAIYYDWIKRGKSIPIIGNGKNRYQLMDVDDLNEAIRLCLANPKNKVNDTFNTGAKEFTTVRKEMDAVLRYAGVKKRSVPLATWLVIPVLKIVEALGISPLYKWVYETAGHDSFVSIEKAEKILGWKPKYSNIEALKRNYDWYIQNAHKYEGQSGVSHRVPWKQGILKVASWFF